MKTLCIISLASAAALARADWTHLGHDGARVAHVPAPSIALTSPAWTLAQTDGGEAIDWIGHASPVVSSDRVCATARIDGDAFVLAVDRTDGSIAWMQPIGSPFLNSFSTPVIDVEHDAVIVASGSDVDAFDFETGSPLWSSALQKPVVNASPVITTDLGPADRLFITDYDGYLLFGGGRLYCINIDTFDAALNPWQPGDVVWSVGLGQASSGNSPAYRNGVVCVADAGNPNFFEPGSIRAWDAAATSAPAPLWTFTNVIDEGFYGGVAIAEANGETCVYAATYAFFGALDSANLVKLDAATGALHWSVACNRSQSIPVPLDDGRVVLSTGIPGFGSQPSLQVFEDHTTSATLVLDTATDSWIDDGDGVIESGEFLSMGGWTHQAVVVSAGGMTLAYAGSPAASSGFMPYTDLRLVDLDADPSEPGFVLDHFAPAGGSAAVVGDTMYTIGPGGLTAFGLLVPALEPDVNGDGGVDANDLYAWDAGVGARDVDGSGMVDGADRSALFDVLRAGEAADITGGGA